MKLILTAIMILLLTTGAWAGSITLDFGTPLTITTSAKQDAAIQTLVDDSNDKRAKANPPLSAQSKEQYLRSVLVSAIKSWRQQVDDRQGQGVKSAWQSADQATKDQIKALLGLN